MSWFAIEGCCDSHAIRECISCPDIIWGSLPCKKARNEETSNASWSMLKSLELGGVDKLISIPSVALQRESFVSVISHSLFFPNVQTLISIAPN